MSARRGKWHPPPVPMLRIIHLPQRSTLAQPPKVAAKAPPTRLLLVSGSNLGALLDEETSFSGGNSERRVRVAASPGESGGDSGEERWRFQAEILRAECNFLQMEREVALWKLGRNRAQMEATLISVMETLVSVVISIYSTLTSPFFPVFNYRLKPSCCTFRLGEEEDRWE